MADAGIVDDQIQPAKTRRDVLHKSVHGSCIRHIGAAAYGLAAVESDEFDSWSPTLEDGFWADSAPVRRHSVLPSKTVEALQGLGNKAFVARAGNGVIYCRGGPVPVPSEMPVLLMKRVKEAFDPRRIFPEWPGLES